MSEARRLSSLRRLGIVDTPPERELDDIADLAVRLYGAAYAAITFVDAGRVWAKAVDGGCERWVAPRAGSPSDRAIASRGGFVTFSLDGELRRGAVAPGPPTVSSVAAAALVAPDGERVGAVELGWASPDHELDERAIGGIRRLAEHISRLLELRSESDEYRRFIELHPDAVTVLDFEGCVELANPGLAQLLGMASTDELIGRDFLDLVVPGERARVAAELARVLFGRRRSLRLDLSLQRADGAAVSCSVSAGHLQAGRRALQLVIRDLEERLRAEGERARLSEQLAQAQRLDLVGRLASGLAHDLNNLVTVMTSNLDLAEMSARSLASGSGSEADEAGLFEDLDQVRHAVGRAGQLTTKLLQFARNEDAGAEEVDVVDAIDAVRKLAEPSLEVGIELTVAAGSDLPPIRADRVHLEQAVVNLVMNAADALPDGGTIRVAARRFDPSCDGEPEVAVDPDRDYVCLEVSDDGTGMDDETLTRAFEPLFTTKRAGKGTGLGLATVLAFVQQVDGVVDLRSEPGEGTTIWMVLPAASAEAAPDGVGDRSQPIAGARVVVVDPNERARGVISRILQGAGYRVSGVGAGEDALKLLRDGGADALVTEAVLPGMPGWRTVERARAEAPDLPALILTSTQAPANIDGARTLVKPFGSERLLRTVSDLLANR